MAGLTAKIIGDALPCADAEARSSRRQKVHDRLFDMQNQKGQMRRGKAKLFAMLQHGQKV